MATKHGVLAAAFILLCYGAIVIRFQSSTSQSISSVKSGTLKTEDDDVNSKSQLPEVISTTKAANLDKQYKYTNLKNSHGKYGKELWGSIHPVFKCPDAHLARVGKSGDGGKWTCGLYRLGAHFEQNPFEPCIVYSFGVNKDSSFESEVLTNTRCSVYAYDPSVKSIAAPLSPLNPRLHFFKMGVGGSNTKNRKTLKTMMEENGGHKWIDIVKMDIERSEYASFDNIFQDFDQLPFGQLLIEIHHSGKSKNASTEKALKLIEDLEKRGFRMFYTEINAKAPNCCSEFSFLNMRTLDKFMDVE